ncbi:N-carbamoyl-L-amino-acid hydrolase [Paenibacillus forsythiae]|uniref:N-carbamoyl-L-amino-acid hydrolase n=2 Tax=Paenibacillus forsythiae TaxID=365616 RepID=A0ABU3H1Z5_9BACL|nr:Zn-dependent hydrolase [Paenibacillus forsythiae]MDT3424837.1 N-carbamoyl-L-amino-acid hydrolase [Paenibacillus forsythiae]
MTDKSPRINRDRLERSLRELAVFGQNARGGLDRTAFTPAELEARAWLKAALEKEGLRVRIDPAANIWGSRAAALPELPAIVCGSHIDTVPDGGKYDGALGVLMALEVLRTLNDSGIATRHPFELVSFSAEEPNPFGLSTFGSRAATGKLTREQIIGVRNSEGTLLADALKEAGGSPERFEEAALPEGAVSAFVEVHIEQGRRLLRRSLPIGVVTAITGIYREEVTVRGEANHAGTTLMEDRSDALTAAAEIVLAAEQICRSFPAAGVVGTVGQLNIKPNAPNIIPAEAVFLVEFRAESREQLRQVLTEWGLRLELLSSRRRSLVTRRLILDQAPSPMDRTVMEALERQAEQLRIPSCRLGSMAGHDAAHLASITRSGMIFVPSLGGKSHCPEEESRMADIEQAANVLLHTLLDLDAALDAGGGAL